MPDMRERRSSQEGRRSVFFAGAGFRMPLRGYSTRSIRPSATYHT